MVKSTLLSWCERNATFTSSCVYMVTRTKSESPLGIERGSFRPICGDWSSQESLRLR